MLLQISSLRSLPAETWAALAAAVGALAVLARKLLARKGPTKPDYLTRAEFHQEMLATRDRIGASFLALADRLDLTHRELLSSLARQSDRFERRLDSLESNLARLDERTIQHPVSSIQHPNSLIH